MPSEPTWYPPPESSSVRERFTESWDFERALAEAKKKQRTARHEAGHAVIGRVLGCPCGLATIIPNLEEKVAGTATTGTPDEIQAEWDKPGKPGKPYRSMLKASHARMMVLMAGAETEVEFYGKCAGGDTDDRKEIAKVASEVYEPNSFWNCYEPRLRRQTRNLIRRHRDKIERVAAALLKRETLQGDEIDSFI